MSTGKMEHVLVVPASVLDDAGRFQGFTGDIGYYLPRLLDAKYLSFMPREQAEHDPSFKQIIPYVVLRCEGRLFHYTRSQKGTEKRLRALRSIGVGGHINPGDTEGSDDLYQTGMYRELDEELSIESDYTEKPIGLINDDALPVGQVHLGIVHLLELSEPNATPRENTMTTCGFARPAELCEDKSQFETWSQFVLDALHVS